MVIYPASFFLIHRLMAMQTEKKTDTLRQLAVFYKALAHPARLAIVERLSVAKACTCNDFVRVLPFAQATISEHLRKLKLAGLIVVSEKGNSSEYCLNKQGFRQLAKLQNGMKVLE